MQSEFQNCQPTPSNMEGNDANRHSLEAFLKASVVEADNGVGAYAENPIHTSVLYVKWAIENYGISSSKVHSILDSTYETFSGNLQHRMNRHFLFLRIMRAFLKDDTAAQFGK